MSSPSLQAAFEPAPPANRIVYPELDGLRAIAFVMVFLQHYLFLPWCLMGVNVFFVLSGFLITGILLDTRAAPHRARNFYMRRTLRIFPLYYGVWIAVAVLDLFFHWQWSWAWLGWPLYLGNFLPFLMPLAAVPGTAAHAAAFGVLRTLHPVDLSFNFGHFWSLCVEEQFYLFWPWVVFFVRRRTLLIVCLIAVAAVPLLRIAVHASAPAWMLQNDLLFRATPFQLDALVWGGLIAVLWRTHSLRERLLSCGRAVALLCAVVAIVYLPLSAHPWVGGDWRHGYIYPAWSRTWGLSFVDVFSAAAIVCCLRPQVLLAKYLGSAPLRWLGRISYGAYVLHDLFHNLVLRFVWHLSGRLPALAACDEQLAALFAFVLTLMLAWLSYRYFETPFLKLKDRFKTEVRATQ